MDAADIRNLGLSEPLVTDLEDRLGQRDLIDWLDNEAEDLSILGGGAQGVVFFTESLLRRRKILGLETGSISGECASIRPVRHGYVVLYRDRVPVHRLRFSIAHEIGHTYWFHPYQLGEPLSPLQRNSIGVLTIEYLCNYFAGALLLPKSRIVKAIAKGSISGIPPLHLIQPLARSFLVAEQAVGRRIFAQILSGSEIAIVRLRRTNYPRMGKESANWQVSWCHVPSRYRRAHMTAGMSIPFLTSSRAIPEEMIPSDVETETGAFEADGRWLDGVTPQSESSSRVSFRNRRSNTTVLAYACRVRIGETDPLFPTSEAPEPESLYLALPMRQDRERQ